MRNSKRSGSSCAHLVKSALPLALAAACLWVADADARRGHGGSHGGSPGWSGGHGGWHGRHAGGSGSRWHGRGHGWHGGRWHGARWHGGWYGPRYWYPGFAWGLGAGVALTYPWWGWGYPTYHYDPTYYDYVERPAGAVNEERTVDSPPATWDTPAYRWYCPSPPGYHPEVTECSQGWLRVLPDVDPPHSPPPG
jgi:hypothetical protein